MSFSTTPILTNDIADLTTPGVQVQLDPEQMDALGITQETALSEDDAWESQLDIPPTLNPSSGNVVALRAVRHE